MPIIFVNPSGHGRARLKKKRSAKMARARKKKKSVRRGRAGRFTSSRRKTRKGGARTRKAKRIVIHFNPAKKKGRKKVRRAGKKTRARRAKARRRHGAAKQRKSARRRPPSTKALRKYAAKKGMVLKRRGKGRRKSARRRKTGTRTRVGRAMSAANRHKTYPLMNPSRRRRKRKNPRRRSSHRRSHRRYRRNPSVAGIMAIAKQALPVLAGMVVGKLITKQIAARIPGIDRLGRFQGPALSLGMLVLGEIATNKVAALGKYKSPILLGLGINVVTELLSMIPQVAGFLGLGEGIYDRALSDYVTTSDYLTTGATPIDDDIALSDYITTGGLEEELGLSEELGVSEELGALDAGTVRGGVDQMAMIKQIPNQSFLSEVPARSFSKEVSRAGEGFDNPGALYAGIFRGGF